MKANDLKLIVSEKYGEIARQSVLQNSDNCCGTSSCCGELEFSMIGDEYHDVDGYNPDADLGLGCGIPTQFASIKPGNRVLDLGSGAGNDCFVAAKLVGENGSITGIDFTEAMVEKANQNLAKSGFKNISFVQGDIENMPLPENNYDVVISNCVLNLVPDKEKAFSEIYRVLKPGGHFCISDVVMSGELPEALRTAAEMYAGCVSGASLKDDYLKIVRNKGFRNIDIKKEKIIVIPDEVLSNYLSDDEIKVYRLSGNQIVSITLTADK
jgi:arsenite methyltransferase